MLGSLLPSGPHARARISIRGHSGTTVRVEETSQGAVVVKASDRSGSDRLRAQISKQRRAREDNNLSFVRIPRILAERDEPSGYAVTMEYIYFQNPVDHLNGVSVAGVRRLGEMLIRLVGSELQQSPLTTVSSEVFHQKLDEIARRLSAGLHYHDYAPHIARLHGWLAETGSLSLPVGRCHGDLTMSNVLISPGTDKLALVDFLDSFVESPLVDLAKIRQDTRFRWTALMADQMIDRVRYGQIMTQLDRVIDDAFSTHRWYADQGEAMIVLTLLRIAPYATRADVHEFLLSALATTRM